MKVSEFIEWLKTQNQDAIVEVNIGRWDQYDHWSAMEPFNPSNKNHWSIVRCPNGEELLELGGEEW